MSHFPLLGYYGVYPVSLSNMETPYSSPLKEQTVVLEQVLDKAVNCSLGTNVVAYFG